MNPSRSKIIVDSILSNNDTKVTLNDLIDIHGLRFESKSRIFKFRDDYISIIACKTHITVKMED